MAPIPPEWEFLQWFPDRKQATQAMIDFAEIIMRKKDHVPGWKVSTPQPMRGGFALYAVPPEGKKEKK